MRRRWRLTRLLDDHHRSEAALDAPQTAGRWNAECGCWWDLPGTADPQWVPCDMHVDRLWRAVQGEEEL